jgi:hypothetical protein
MNSSQRLYPQDDLRPTSHATAGAEAMGVRLT